MMKNVKCLVELAMILQVLTAASDAVMSKVGCSVNRSCWFQPPGCTNDCTGSVQWSSGIDGIDFWIESSVTDLQTDDAYYTAIGFSKDMRMGDDTVLECIIGPDGVGRVLISFNDETSNMQLLQASEVMLKDSTVSLADGFMSCKTKWIFYGRDKVDQADLFKVFNLNSQEWHLLFARGNADKRSFVKYIHSMNDGPLFPWICTDTVQFCAENCTNNQMVIISEMRQSDVSRYWRYRFAVIHGVFMIFAWWGLISSAILIARFFKPVWIRKRLLGTAVWFQIHRDFAIVSVILQGIALFLIIYQAGRLYECSYECTLEDWAKKMHVITGLSASVLAITQPLIALIRPGPNSQLRPIFNWMHWFIGMSAWSLATATIFLAVPLGKTGLLRVYGHSLTWIFAIYVIIFILCNIFLELLSFQSERRSDKIGSSVMVMSVINGPSTEAAVAAEATYPIARLTTVLFHGTVSMIVIITVTVMLVKILLSHSS